MIFGWAVTMNDRTKKQKGSKSRDKFKVMHKHIMSKDCWALNSDLELVEKKPRPFIVARLDFKLDGDSISFTEAISYSQFINMPPEHRIPVYIIEANREFRDYENDDADVGELLKHKDKHRFTIKKLLKADYVPDPPVTETKVMKENITWEELAAWEVGLRAHRRKEIAELIKLGKFS
jgi:hypothetical protein